MVQKIHTQLLFLVVSHFLYLQSVISYQENHMVKNCY